MAKLTSHNESYPLPNINDRTPAAINGPTGTPLKKATPINVPTIRPFTMVGLIFINIIPRDPSQETKIPTAMANKDCHVIKDLKMSLIPNDPSAKGTIIAAVNKTIPIVRPY